VTVKEVLEAARAAGESHQFSYDTIASVPAVDGIYAAIDEAVGDALGQRTMRDLALANPPVGNDGAAPAEEATGLVTAVPAQQISSVDGDGPAPSEKARS